ncbi:MAG: hypothetical protein KME26_22380 [Oscillatoria princeps RMCB-10]|nr:hypothetical protein [Oscillatoria princeps RMCB-10]
MENTGVAAQLAFQIAALTGAQESVRATVVPQGRMPLWGRSIALASQCRCRLPQCTVGRNCLNFRRTIPPAFARGLWNTGVAASAGAGSGTAGEGYVRFALVCEPGIL